MTGKLKIGIICDDMLLQSWEYAIIERIQDSDYAEIMLVLKNLSANRQKDIQGLNSQNPVVRIHQKLDALIFNQKNNYSDRKNISGLVGNVPVLIFGNTEAGGIVSTDTRELSEISKYRPDVILNFGSGFLKGEILQIPRYGIWSFPLSATNDLLKIRGGYCEVVNKEPVTDSAMVILKESEGGSVTIASSSESTCSYSINLTRNRVFWRSALFVPRILTGLHKYGEVYLESLIMRNKLENKKSSVSLYMPASPAALGNLFGQFNTACLKVLKKIYYTDAFSWVLYYDVNNHDAADAFQSNFNSFRKLVPPKGKFWADPFVVANNGSLYVFVEEFIYKTNKGHLSVLELDREGRLVNCTTIIDKPFHLSYPFVFKQENTYYMIPESCSNRTVDLYKCTQFPYEWEYDRNIMRNVRAVDTTLFFYSNKWWLFMVTEELDGMETCETELFLYFSDDLFSGEWESHPLNPVVADSRIARPAGNIFVQDGKIYRPSQDCSVRYGNALNLNEIVTLSETEYEERMIYKRRPDWNRNLKGMHTFNSSGGFSIIDVYSYHRRIPF